MFARHARGTQGGGDAACAGQGQHAPTRLPHSGHQARAGIAHCRGASIAHIGHAGTFRQASDDALRGLGLVVLVHRQQLCAGSLKAVSAQQLLGVAGVFAGHHIDLAQHMQRAQADVGQVANGRGHDIQCVGRVVLRAGCFIGSFQGFGKRG